jgi:hypothetical protein
MSAEDVSRAINFMGTGMGFGRSPAPAAPTAPPLGGANSQGTLPASSVFGGVNVVNVDTVSMGRARPAFLGMSPPTVTMAEREREGIQPVCMFLTSVVNINENCLGCIGQKGEKFCTKRKQGTSEQDTCGTVSHTKKALVESEHIYFWNHGKDQGYMVPSLAVTFSLSASVYALQGESVTRVQFNELVGLVKSQEVTTEDELIEVKERVMADSGVSFTPRKKP